MYSHTPILNLNLRKNAKSSFNNKKILCKVVSSNNSNIYHISSTIKNYVDHRLAELNLENSLDNQNKENQSVFNICLNNKSNEFLPIPLKKSKLKSEKDLRLKIPLKMSYNFNNNMTQHYTNKSLYNNNISESISKSINNNTTKNKKISKKINNSLSQISNNCKNNKHNINPSLRNNLLDKNYHTLNTAKNPFNNKNKNNKSYYNNFENKLSKYKANSLNRIVKSINKSKNKNNSLIKIKRNSKKNKNNIRIYRTNISLGTSKSKDYSIKKLNKYSNKLSAKSITPSTNNNTVKVPISLSYSRGFQSSEKSGISAFETESKEKTFDINYFKTFHKTNGNDNDNNNNYLENDGNKENIDNTYNVKEKEIIDIINDKEHSWNFDSKEKYCGKSFIQNSNNIIDKSNKDNDFEDREIREYDNINKSKCSNINDSKNKINCNMNNTRFNYDYSDCENFNDSKIDVSDDLNNICTDNKNNLLSRLKEENFRLRQQLFMSKEQINDLKFEIDMLKYRNIINENNKTKKNKEKHKSKSNKNSISAKSGKRIYFKKNIKKKNVYLNNKSNKILFDKNNNLSHTQKMLTLSRKIQRNNTLFNNENNITKCPSNKYMENKFKLNLDFNKINIRDNKKINEYKNQLNMGSLTNRSNHKINFEQDTSNFKDMLQKIQINDTTYDNSFSYDEDNKENINNNNKNDDNKNEEINYHGILITDGDGICKKPLSIQDLSFSENSNMIC